MSKACAVVEEPLFAVNRSFEIGQEPVSVLDMCPHGLLRRGRVAREDGVHDFTMVVQRLSQTFALVERLE